MVHRATCGPRALVCPPLIYIVLIACIDYLNLRCSLNLLVAEPKVFFSHGHPEYIFLSICKREVALTQ